MASRTRNAIVESFIRLLEERPVNKISVKDIVEDCGINRNTFYYHFADIPSLADGLLRAEADAIAHNVVQLNSLEACMEIATRHCKENRRAIGHLYRYVDRESYERHLLDICEHIVTIYIDDAIGGRPLPPDDRSTIIEGYKCELFGFITDWLRRGMSEDMEREFLNLCALRDGMLETMIERGLSRRGGFDA